MKKGLLFGIIFTLIGLLLCFIPSHIAPVCGPMQDGGFMKCHWTGRSIKGLGAVLAFLGIAFLILKNEALRCGLSIAGIALGVLTIMIPLKLIGTCKMPAMGCNMHTKPAVYLLAGIYIILHIIYLLLNRKEWMKK
ncbi:MAG: DUF4418 family protein [Johnsonella sp.]|nr:DUF4418 family protein [Johnsonella sp.]